MAQQMNTTAIVIVALIVVGVLGAIYLTGGKIGTTSNENTISVTGNSEMKVDPDTLVIYLNIETRNSSADKAKDENTEITNDVMDALEDLGIDEKDIQTENYQIYPEYDWTTSTQRLKGYVVTNSIKVILTDFDKAGEVVDATVDEGALVSYISFELSNAKENEFKTDVMKEASEDAKSKAEAIAEGLDKQLGKVVSVTASDYNFYPYYLYERADSSVGGVVSMEEAKSAVADISPSQLEVRASVTIAYEIK